MLKAVNDFTESCLTVHACKCDIQSQKWVRHSSACGTGGEHDRIWQLGTVDVHDHGPGVQGNHHWLVFHQCLHLHQQLCSKCKEGKPEAHVMSKA